jgi:hypothetical protein
MSDEPTKPGRTWLKAASVFGLVCALHILSVGPATWLILKVDPDLDGWPTTVASWVYWPVLPACELTGTERVYVRYLSLFVRHPALEHYFEADGKR